MAIDELVVELTAQNKELLATLKSSVAATQSSSDAMAAALAELKKKGEKESSGLQRAMEVMAGYISGEAVLGAFERLKDFAKDLFVEGVKDAIAYQDALQQLNTSLALNGAYSESASKQLDDFADNLEKTTKFSDDAALSAAKLLSTLTQLDANGLEKATQTSADLAAALGIDLETAARLVGKAINGQEEALKKYGVTLTGIQDGVKNTDAVMSQLNARFGGAAAAQVNTFGGQLQLLQKAYGDMAKEIGKAITENDAFFVMIKVVKTTLQSLTQEISNNKAGLGETFALLAEVGAKAGKYLIQAFELVRDAVQLVTLPVRELFMAIATGVEASAALIDGDLTLALEKTKAGFSSMADEAAAPFTETYEPLQAMYNVLDKIDDAADTGFSAMGAAAEASKPAIDESTQAINAQAIAKQQLAESDKLAAEQALLNAESTRAMQALELEELNLHKANQLIAEEEYWAARQALLMQSLETEKATLDAQRTSGQISEEQHRLKMLELQKKATVESQKLEADKTKSEAAERNLRYNQASQFFGDIASLSKTGNKELGAIAKGAAIAQATISGFQAVQNALATPPYPVGVALAAAAGIAAAANVAKIASTPLATGIDEVPQGFNNDTFPASLSSGERVVPKNTNQDLKEFLSNPQQSGPTFNITLNDVMTTDARTLGLRIVDAINEAAQAMDVRLIGVRTV